MNFKTSICRKKGVKRQKEERRRERRTKSGKGHIVCLFYDFLYIFSRTKFFACMIFEWLQRRTLYFYNIRWKCKILFFLRISNSAVVVVPSTPKKNNLPMTSKVWRKLKRKRLIFWNKNWVPSENIKNEILLQELKKRHALKAGETNLKKYILRRRSAAKDFILLVKI